MGAGLDVVTDALALVHGDLLGVTDGAVADYIPQLALADRDQFGLALASMDGHRYEAGDARVVFTMQSVSKPFVYALALADLGLDEVSRWVRAEPSGEAFNAISLEPGTGRPANPMINAGAIVATALVPGADPQARFERILDCLSAFAGRRLDVDEKVYASEAATGDRNRALAFLMRSAGSLPGEVDEAVDTYFRQCAVRATTADLAAMAATLANGGVNPVTGIEVVPELVTVQVLAVMATCGMYDAAGDWLLRVGLPAKSGVSGGVIAASPARFGVAAYSPPLDAAGNSVRAVAALRQLSARFGLHLMHAHAPAGPTVTVAGTAREHPSMTVRRPAEQAVVDSGGDRIGIVAAQGALDFPAAEQVLFAIGEVTPAVPGWVMCDFGRVTRVEPVAAAMLSTALARLAERGHRVGVVGEALASEGDGVPPWRGFGSLDAAVTWAEQGLLGEH